MLYIKKFKKYGRTLHRFVSEDISQVIHFQSGMPAHGMGGLLCVNVGIRIPECSDRVFQPKAEKKKYYHDYDCTIRSRLGTVSGKQETWSQQWTDGDLSCTNPIAHRSFTIRA